MVVKRIMDPKPYGIRDADDAYASAWARFSAIFRYSEINQCCSSVLHR